MIDPSITSTSYDEMAAKWALPRALMGGTPAMKKAGNVYLPRHPAENPAVYNERAKRAVLRNYYRRTVQKIVGRVFANPVMPSTDLPSSIQNNFKNIDLMGRGLNAFAQSWFEDALVSGLSYVLVDFPDQNKTAQGNESIIRPYAVHIPAEQVIAVQWDEGSAVPKLSQVRIREKNRDYQGFSEENRERIRVLEPNHWFLLEETEKGDWQTIDDGANSLGEIPLVTLYSNRTGYMEAVPPLEDLAYLNLEHYQIRSDQRNALNVASFPILAASGYDPEIDGPIEVGPNKVLTTSDPDGKYYYVESSGAALEAGARELADLEKNIRLFGLQFEQGQGSETATGRLIDANDALSPIAAMTAELEDSLNSVLRLFAKWSGVEHFGALKMQFSNVENGTDASGINDLLALWKAGVISQQDIQKEVISRGIVSDSLAFNAPGV